jgi:hypothetical protein
LKVGVAKCAKGGNGSSGHDNSLDALKAVWLQELHESPLQIAPLRIIFEVDVELALTHQVE